MLDQILSLNTILITLAVGTILWAIRKVIPANVEKHKIWKTLLPVIPILIGVGLSMIPGLMPFKNISQSIIIGGVAGSLSSTVYDFVREALGDGIKRFLGGKK